MKHGNNTFFYILFIVVVYTTMVIYTTYCQNVAGVNSNIGFFFDMFHGKLNNVQAGWFAQGHDVGDTLVDALVTSVDIANELITIALPFQFQSGRSYVFTSERVTPVISNTCFPKGTLIRTNQGNVPIDQINPFFHTIRNKRIVTITQTISIDKHLVCFEKDSLGHNIPCERTITSPNHAIFIKNQPIKAKYFPNTIPNVTFVKYTGEKLYNILMEDYDKMMVNNLICETLHPSNVVAKLYSSDYSVEQINEFVVQMNSSVQMNLQIE